MASQPVAVVSFAAPEDRPLLAQWEKHLLQLQQAGRVTLWSEQHILPGSERDEQIAKHLEQADIIVLLLSADFFANEECYNLMESTLQRSKSSQARIIPLLLRPVGWRETPIGSLACLPNNGRAITRWGNRDEAFQDCVNSLAARLSPQAAQQVSVPGRSSAPVQQSQPSSSSHHSCFLSYSSKEETLAQRLYADLKAQGVDCWFAPHSMKIGARIRLTIDQAIHQQAKLLLLLSQHSLESSWVEDEVEAALERERTERCEMLFPIRLDNAVTQPDAPAWAVRLRRQVNIGDFSNWTDQQAYEKAFERLLGDLENANN
ncbi:MAG TPA: toll/interleukin-1 receptor domain-containing protein [Ktedonobacteraceae bacterium]|nr:toll/interleukin-1 receptor domain-containing protein [Ktedonobacteraceae bacterium]